MPWLKQQSASSSMELPNWHAKVSWPSAKKQSLLDFYISVVPYFHVLKSNNIPWNHSGLWYSHRICTYCFFMATSFYRKEAFSSRHMAACLIFNDTCYNVFVIIGWVFESAFGGRSLLRNFCFWWVISLGYFLGFWIEIYFPRGSSSYIMIFGATHR